MWQKAGKSWPVAENRKRPANWLTFRKFGFFSWMSLISWQIDNLAALLQDTALMFLSTTLAFTAIIPDAASGNWITAAWMHTLTVNTQAPVKMAEAFLPHLKRGDKKLLASISSQMGSIADNGSGGSILYRTSKAALNAAMKSIAIDLEGQGIEFLFCIRAGLKPIWAERMP